MKKKGKIVNINGRNIKILLIEDNSISCKGCRFNGICNVNDGGRFIELKSDKNLKVGDMVQLELAEGRSIFLAFLLFIMPLLVIVTTFTGLSKTTLGELPSILIALAAGSAYFAIILLLEKWLLKKTRVQVIEGGDDGI